jgi:hypothetical protein
METSWDLVIIKGKTEGLVEKLAAGVDHLKGNQTLVTREKVSRDAAFRADYGNLEGCPKGCGKLILN